MTGHSVSYDTISPSNLLRNLSSAGPLELRLAAEAMTLGLRSSSTNMRNKWAGFVARLTQRVVASLRAGRTRSRTAVGDSVDIGGCRLETKV